ncbi:hypothetical protein GCM10010399_17220 [Dactylosporangium fulvum]
MSLMSYLMVRAPARYSTSAGSRSRASTSTARSSGIARLRRIALAEGSAEVSYWVLPSSRGRGVAPRALTAFVSWCFATLGLHRVELNHSTANPASCRVALKADFPAEGTKRSEALHDDGWHDMHLHARLSTDS